MKITIEPEQGNENQETVVYTGVVEYGLYGLRITTPQTVEHFTRVMGDCESLLGKHLMMEQRIREYKKKAEHGTSH